MGTVLHPQSLLDGFRRVIDDCLLLELDLSGGKYTWEKSRGTSNWVRERLDRAFVSRSWLSQFPMCHLSVHHTSCSDHDPINLDLLNVTCSMKRFRFRFENTWLEEPSFRKEVTEYWLELPPTHILPKLIDKWYLYTLIGLHFHLNWLVVLK
ncbi:uncharacterized protein LOC135153017 [Daucus carota subsp. sativus]|uniref:uncharacterized protein LOC135153017 n=1 Tax=Daucus carota subsp. sativus TaxID=79200 RepID=UPI003082EDD3